MFLEVSGNISEGGFRFSVHFKHQPTKAKALMKYYNVIHRELTMQKVFGDVRARAGTSVCVGMGLGDINIKNYMCVEKAKHTFSNGLYTMDLYLSGIRGEFSA